jgi:hypothetical protein
MHNDDKSSVATPVAKEVLRISHLEGKVGIPIPIASIFRVN